MTPSVSPSKKIFAAYTRQENGLDAAYDDLSEDYSKLEEDFDSLRDDFDAINKRINHERFIFTTIIMIIIYTIIIIFFYSYLKASNTVCVIISVPFLLLYFAISYLLGFLEILIKIASVLPLPKKD